MPVTIVETAQAMRQWADAQRARGRTIALVPTMGFLHEGHLSLVRRAQALADVTVVSIFVNPTQFGPNEDLSRYPRDLDGDLAKLDGVDAVFTPTQETIYPEGFDTRIVPDEMAKVLCGESRPLHFAGVCTVVMVLLRITRAQVAVFGEKDFQQLQIIRRMVRDLWLDVDIQSCPIIREPDGLAMSSRNTYLRDDERRDALVLNQTLSWMREQVSRGERDAARLIAAASQRIEGSGRVRLDYLAIVDPETLRSVTTIDPTSVAAVAAWVGSTRLIDNGHLG